MKFTILSIALIFFFMSHWTYGQVVNTSVMDTLEAKLKGKVVIDGYVDAYYGYDFSQPGTKERPYFVSMARHNEANINLAYVAVKYTSSRVRARFVPGFGSYVNANYAAEQGVLKNIIEGNVGIKLLKSKEIWLDFGVLGSPYTNESAISKDHLAYTRSFAPEYVPYYLSGAKLSMPLGKKVNFYFYLLNGWQQIRDVNNSKSIGTQLEYRPNDNLLINWNTYIGNENSELRPDFGNRYFTDIYFIYSKGKFSGTSCFYIGAQEAKRMRGATETQWWYNANLIGRYHVTPAVSLTGRIEYFDDPKSVQISPINPINGFTSSSASLGLNYAIEDNILLRLESRSFFSSKQVYQNAEGNPTSNSQLLISSMTVWF